MKNENIVSMLERLVTEAEALSEGKSSVEVEEDPLICGLMLQAESDNRRAGPNHHHRFPEPSGESGPLEKEYGHESVAVELTVNAA